MTRAKVVKAHATNKFEVALCELPSGQYVVAYQTLATEDTIFGEPVQDYKTADVLFEMKLSELEGH